MIRKDDPRIFGPDKDTRQLPEPLWIWSEARRRWIWTGENPEQFDGDEVCQKCGRRADGHPYTDDEIGSRRCLYPLTSTQYNDGRGVESH